MHAKAGVICLAAALPLALWAHAYFAALADRVPACMVGQVLSVGGRVLGVEAVTGQVSRLSVEITETDPAACVPLAGRRVRLNWYQPPQAAVGDLWRLEAKVRPPWGYQNPGGFNFERWLLANAYDGSGYVRSGTLVRRGATLRAAVIAHLDGLLEAAGLQHSNALMALAAGLGERLSDDDWQRLRATGTMHLFVVSGLHVSLVAGFGALLGQLLAHALQWLSGGRPVRTRGFARWSGALAAAAGYAWLAAWGVPLMRALLMAAAAMLAWSGARRLAPWWLWLGALWTILVMTPLAALSQGLVLSFAAVAALIGVFGNRRPGLSVVGGLFAAQVGLAFLLTPLLAVMTGIVPMHSALANLIAVPLVSLGLIPLTLAAALSSAAAPGLATLLFTGADRLLGVVFGWLDWLGSEPVLLVGPGMSAAAAALAAGALIVRLPGLFRALPLLGLWAAWMLPADRLPAPGDLRVIALDVGQGSAVIVDTHRHRLLYDAGARFASGFDLGEAVVVPSLASTGPRRLDRLVISHGDNDHAGGADAVLAAFPAEAVITQAECRAGQRWQWDGVSFEFLHPVDGTVGERSTNRQSCVLLIEARGRRVLLTGDIDRVAEAGLAWRLDEGVDLLMAPHHGSDTSSSRRFIALAGADIVWFSAGRHNAYGHPHPGVVQRYRRSGAMLCSTAEAGALLWRASAPRSVWQYRREHAGLWGGRYRARCTAVASVRN